jgi:hypothetical protein
LGKGRQRKRGPSGQERETHLFRISDLGLM